MTFTHNALTFLDTGNQNIIRNEDNFKLGEMNQRNAIMTLQEDSIKHVKSNARNTSVSDPKGHNDCAFEKHLKC